MAPSATVQPAGRSRGGSVLESRTACSTQISTPPTRSMMALNPSKSKTAKWSICTPVKSSTATVSSSGPVAASPHPFRVALIRV